MAWVRPLSGVALVVPFYHMVSDEYVPHVSNLYRFRSVAEFKADLEYFARHFTPVSLDDIVDALDGKRTLPQSCFHLTFDDGFREMHDIVSPILRQAGVPATFFLITSFLDGGGLPHYNAISVLIDRIRAAVSAGGNRATMARLESVLPAPANASLTIEERLRSLGYAQKTLLFSIAEILGVDLDQYVQKQQPHLRSEHVRAMVNQGFNIGSHSLDHPLYSELPFTEQLTQTRTSLEFLEREFEARPRAFAFPHNDDGVDREFFDAVFSKPMLDVSFGTSGLVRHFHPRNIQRVSMEKTPASAAQILARQFTRATYLRLRPSKQTACASKMAANAAQ